MKRRLFLTAAVGLASLPVREAVAVVVTCANCSTIFTQLMEYARQAQQLASQVQSYQLQLQQYANMVTNTVSLPQNVWSNAQSDIMQVRNLTNQASLLTGNSGDILSRLSSTTGYTSQVGSMPDNYANQLVTWQQTLANGTSSLGRTLGVQQGQEQNYTAMQTAIQAHSQTAAGQMQAIQAGNELAGLTNTQLQQIQTTLTAQAQMIATRNQVLDDKTAMEEAYTLTHSRYNSVAMTGSQGF